MNTLVAGGYTTVLGFNEPDNTGQSNMTVATAISALAIVQQSRTAYRQPCDVGQRGGPDVVKDFTTQVDADTTGTLRVDFIAAHWYGVGRRLVRSQRRQPRVVHQGPSRAFPAIVRSRLHRAGCMNLSNPDDGDGGRVFQRGRCDVRQTPPNRALRLVSVEHAQRARPRRRAQRDGNGVRRSAAIQVGLRRSDLSDRVLRALTEELDLLLSGRYPAFACTGSRI